MQYKTPSTDEAIRVVGRIGHLKSVGLIKPIVADMFILMIMMGLDRKAVTQLKWTDLQGRAGGLVIVRNVKDVPAWREAFQRPWREADPTSPEYRSFQHALKDASFVTGVSGASLAILGGILRRRNDERLPFVRHVFPAAVTADLGDPKEIDWKALRDEFDQANWARKSVLTGRVSPFQQTVRGNNRSKRECTNFASSKAMAFPDADWKKLAAPLNDKGLKLNIEPRDLQWFRLSKVVANLQFNPADAFLDSGLEITADVLVRSRAETR